MPRTTIDLDRSVLRRLRDVSVREGKSMGRIASELLAKSLDDDGRGGHTPGDFKLRTAPLGSPTVDLEDKEAVRVALERRPD